MRTILMGRICFVLILLFFAGISVAQTYTLQGSPQLIEKKGVAYTNNMAMIWDVNVGVNKPVKISYYVGTENNYDKVYIVDVDANGNTTGITTTLMGSMSGTYYTKTTTGRVRISFFTDGSGCGPAYYGIYLLVEADLGLVTSGDLRVGGNNVVSGRLQVGGTSGYNGILYANSETALGTTQGSSVPISRFRANTNGSRMSADDYLYREFAGSDWSSASYLRGIGVDVSFMLPGQMPCSWIKQYPMDRSVSLGHKEKTMLRVCDFESSSPNIQGEVQLGFTNGIKNGYGYKLSFLGAYENSDPLYMARYNHTDNSSSLRMNIGDDSAGEDRFEVGTSTYNTIDWTPRFTVLNNGRVGIGTSSPQYLLDVKGTIRASEVMIQSVDQFADFVFDESYRLPSLEEVKSHIDEKGHLPNIPSAAEVKENGMNLVEMQVKLLQKIEELTLYILEQDQKVKEQEERIKVLESKK